MGISYATLGAGLGIPVTVCMPENATIERLRILRALGAEVILTPAEEGSDGAIQVARSIAERKSRQYWYANQYDNAANWRAHYLTTGPEVMAQTRGLITHFVAGVGTSGTLMGCGRYLREHSAAVRLVAVEPDAALHGLEGLKHMPTARRPSIFDEKLADRTVRISTEAARAMVLRLAREEGLLVGISSGAAAAAALEVASELDAGTVVTVFPDAGFKYLSDSSMWEGA
jgi:cysteine synthase B